MAASGWWGATTTATAGRQGSRGPLVAPGQVAARRVGRGRAGGLCVPSATAAAIDSGERWGGVSIGSRQVSTSTSGSPGFCWSRRSGRRASQKAVHGIRRWRPSPQRRAGPTVRRWKHNCGLGWGGGAVQGSAHHGSSGGRQQAPSRRDNGHGAFGSVCPDAMRREPRR